MCGRGLALHDVIGAIAHAGLSSGERKALVYGLCTRALSLHTPSDKVAPLEDLEDTLNAVRVAAGLAVKPSIVEAKF